MVGRGRVIADTTVRELLAGTARGRVTLRTSEKTRATAVLTAAGAAVTVTGPGTLSVSGLTTERVVEVLGGHVVPFSEVSAHRASLEEAYLELTRDVVEYRSAGEVAR